MKRALWLSPRSLELGLLIAISAALACGSDRSSSGGAGSPTGTSGVGGVDAGGGGAGGVDVGQPGVPHVGAHGLSFYRYGENRAATISAPPLATKASGSTLIVSAGRGDFAAFAPPSDNKGNAPFTQLGQAHTYTNWSSSGTALYSFSAAVGGPNHVISNSNAPGDEITLAVVEVTGSSHVQDQQWVERLSGQPSTSAAVTTTGPATLVAFWWGDGGADGDKVAVPNNGFVVLDSVGLAGSLVQCFVAAKDVSAAGTYDVTWQATPQQGAQLWLVAVQ